MLNNFWNGKGSLAAAFWGVGVLGQILLFVFFLTLVFVFKKLGLTPIITVVVYILGALAWSVFSFIVIWKCAKNTSKKIWHDLAKFYVIAVPVIYIAAIVIRKF